MNSKNDNKKEIVEMNSGRLWKIIEFIVVACLLFVVAFIIYGSVSSPDVDYFYSDAYVYDGVWTYEREDGTEEQFIAPKLLDANIGDIVTISTIIPDNITDEDYFCIVTGRSFKAYIDNVEIYSFDAGIKKIPGTNVKSVHFPIKMKTSYAGKKMTIVRGDPGCRNTSVNVSYVGNLLGIVKLAMADRLFQFVSASLLAVFAMATLIVFSVISINGKRNLPLVYLAEGVLVISLWIIFDSLIFQFVFGTYFYDGVVGYMLATLMGAPFFQYVDSIQGKRYSRIYNYMILFEIVNFVVLTILHFTNVLSFERCLFYIDSLLVVYVIVIFFIIFRDYYVYKNKEHKYVLIGFWGMGIMGVIEIVVILARSATFFSSSIDGSFIVLGLFFFLSFAILDQVNQLSEMQMQTKEALAATKAKSQFLANMSHEIRTPINAIMGMNEMILRESNQESVKEYARDVGAASENLLEIVNDILDFSKIETGMLEIVEDKYNLGEVISDVTTLLTLRAENKGLTLKTVVNPELPNILIGDDKRIRETMVNTLNNAVKYTQEGSIELNVDGEVLEDKVILNISISDTGQGIKPEDLDRIFKGFERADIKKNRNIEGSGLGLSITKRLVELMGGTISVESEYGKGSTFTISLPQPIASNEKIGDYRNHRHASKADAIDSEVNKDFEAPTASVLVVDDTPLNLRVIGKLLGRTRIKVTTASSGPEALDLMKNNHFDVILLDHMMPNMDGIETLKAARKMEGNMCKDTPVIALTANAIVGAKDSYIEVGFDDYLSKPVHPQNLEEMMLRYIPKEKIIQNK